MKDTRWIGSFGVAALALCITPLALGQAQPPDEAEPTESRAPDTARERASRPNTFEGFDFGQIVETMESSVTPLQTEMDRSFRIFTDRIREAEMLLDAGRTNEAVQAASAAIGGVLQVRDDVLNPMWNGQRALTEQTGRVRQRLARAASLQDNEGEPVDFDPDTEATLNNIAGRIAEETDPTRQQRLTAHYRTVRNLARIKTMAQQLSPDQRQLWMNVLHVLDEAALAHQQVLMGSEVLFAQLEATSINLQEYMALMETVEGASELLSVVRGANDQKQGLTGFVQSMTELQDRLGVFNESVQQALEGRMIELSAQIDAIEPLQGDVTVSGGAPVMSSRTDGELRQRIERLRRGQPR